MHKLKRVIAILGVWLMPFAVFAANEVTITADTTLVLGSDSSNYTLKSSSQFDTMSADSTTFSFTLSKGGRVTLISADRKKLDTNASAPVTAAFTCGTDQSQLILGIDDPFTTTAVTVTPSGTCTTGSGSGGGSGGGGGGSGGGGGGGGGGSSGGGTSTAPGQAADKLVALKAQITSIQAKIAEKKGASSATVPHAFGVFARNLAPGTRDEEVRRLQEALATDKDIYPEGLVTGFFGPATTRAVKSFQKRHGLPQVGNVGPLTRKKLGEIFSKAPVSQAPAVSPAPVQTPATPPAPTAPASTLTTSQVGAIQEQIKALQAKLLAEQIKLIQEKINSLKK